MHAHQADTTAETARERLRDLAATLTARGLTVNAHERAGVLVAKNDAAHSDDPRGQHMNPGLSQVVVLGRHTDGSVGWFWQWSGPTRDASPEHEYICPVDAVAEVAERISRVLALASV